MVYFVLVSYRKIGSPSQTTSRAPELHIMVDLEVVETDVRDSATDIRDLSPDLIGTAITSVDCATCKVP